jgi:hypothetical protein
VREHALDVLSIVGTAIVLQSPVRAWCQVHESHYATRAVDGEHGSETVGAPDEGNKHDQRETRKEVRELPKVPRESFVPMILGCAQSAITVSVSRSNPAVTLGKLYTITGIGNASATWKARAPARQCMINASPS